MNHIEIVSFLWGVADLTPRDAVHFMVDRLKELGNRAHLRRRDKEDRRPGEVA